MILVILNRKGLNYESEMNPRTGIVGGEDGGAAEVAVPGVAAGNLVELVHRERCVR